MLQRETQPAQILDPRLRVIKGLNGQEWYCDLHAGTCFKEPRFYETPKGGICAENMGLGKTLICLALILATKHLSSKAPVEYSVGSTPVRKTTGSLMDMAASTIGRTGTPWKRDLSRLEFEHGYEFGRVRTALKQGAGFYWLPPATRRRQTRNPTAIPPRQIWLTNATLVVVPANLISQWKEEIKKHTPGLNVFIVDSPKINLPSAPELADFDLILFSKPAFEKELRDKGEDLTSTSLTCLDGTGIHQSDCGCFKGSPLKDLHFKRLITDEGHNFGNASKSSKTEAVIAVDSLQLDARWIVSGTPTQGLYGVDEAASPVSKRHLQYSDSSNSSEDADGQQGFPKSSLKQEKLFFQQERKDLEKLGNIATMYLKARPWANTFEDRDMASWSTLIMQPRHGRKSHGDAEILKSTLEGMIIRHRAEDVKKELQLPPLHQKVIYLEGSVQDRISLNMFSMMIVSNAVTSERRDADYLFHPRQRGPLQTLVSNLRQASFHWSGYTTEMVQSTVNISKKFLEERKVPVTPEDEQLLRQAIQMGEVALSNGIFKVVSKIHEMTMYVQNNFEKMVAAAWALDGDHRRPTLMGAHMITEAQKFLGARDVEGDPEINFTEEGIRVMKEAYLGNITKPQTKRTKKAPALAGGVTVEEPSKPGTNSSPRKSIGNSNRLGEASLGFGENSSGSNTDESSGSAADESLTGFEERREQNNKVVEDHFLHILTCLYSGAFTPFDEGVDYFQPERKVFTTSTESASIISTASAKLSYLMDQIHLYHENEKIIVFYEAENVAYYIAQALECMNIQHLIYAKSLSTARRSQYVVTFNQTPHFRVLLMDVQQAAFGLDMSAASRVYFVNPVFSPQVEAQAVKRAHRIGQLKPVYVETLVLKGSIEEAIVRRRDHMTNQEHNKLKTILDDNTMYEWIKNVRFSPLPTESIPGPSQMAELKYPQPIFRPRLSDNPALPSRGKENRKNFKSQRKELFRTILRYRDALVNEDREVIELMKKVYDLPPRVRQMIAHHLMGRELVMYYRSHWKDSVAGRRYISEIGDRLVPGMLGYVENENSRFFCA
jgi:superfamily II DNA or RNA helicase